MFGIVTAMKTLAYAKNIRKSFTKKLNKIAHRVRIMKSEGLSRLWFHKPCEVTMARLPCIFITSLIYNVSTSVQRDFTDCN